VRKPCCQATRKFDFGLRPLVCGLEVLAGNPDRVPEGDPAHQERRIPPSEDVTNLVSESSKLVLKVRKLVRREVSESRPSGAVQTSEQPKSVAVTPRTHQLRKRLRELIGTRLQPLGLLSPLALDALDRGQLLTMTESRSLLCGLDCQRHLTAPLLPFLPLALRRHDSVYHAEVPGSLESSMSTACTTDDTRVSQPPVVSPERGPDTVTS